MEYSVTQVLQVLNRLCSSNREKCRLCRIFVSATEKALSPRAWTVVLPGDSARPFKLLKTINKTLKWTLKLTGKDGTDVITPCLSSLSRLPVNGAVLTGRDQPTKGYSSLGVT